MRAAPPIARIKAVHGSGAGQALPIASSSRPLNPYSKSFIPSRLPQQQQQQQQKQRLQEGGARLGSTYAQANRRTSPVKGVRKAGGALSPRQRVSSPRRKGLHRDRKGPGETLNPKPC